MICGIEWRPDGNGSINIAKARISYLDGNSCEALDNTRHALDLAIEGNYTNEIRSDPSLYSNHVHWNVMLTNWQYNTYNRTKHTTSKQHTFVVEKILSVT
jgi:hypothetical protein